MTSPYWQHTNPLKCPKNHKMIWLGKCFWICDKCKPKVIYVATYE